MSGGGLSSMSGGGLSSMSGGGLSSMSGGGLSSLPGGGLYAGPCSNPYRSNIPPIHIWIPLLRQHGRDREADILANAHEINL